MKKRMSIILIAVFCLLTPIMVFGKGKEDQAADTKAKVEAAIGTIDYTLPTSGIGTPITTSVKASKKYTIACVVKNSTNPYMVSQLEGVKKAGLDMGFEAIAMAPTQGDNIEEQVKIVEDLIQRKVDAIIIHCVDSNGIMPAVRRAEQANIPVVTIGTPAAVDTFLRTGVNYEETGYEVAKYIAQKLGGKGDVILLEGPPAAQNAIERLAGIHRAFKDFPGIKVVASQPANFNRNTGMTVTENLIPAHRDVAAVIGANDESAIGGLQALRAAGLNNVLVAGFDGSKDASTEIKNGGLTVTYNTDPYGSGYLACAYLVQFLNSGTKPPRVFVPFPSANDDPLITRDNIDTYITSFAWWDWNTKK